LLFLAGGIPAGWTSGTIRLGDPSATSGDKFSVSVSGNTLSTSATIYNRYPAGTNVYFVLHSHQSRDPVATPSNVDHWGFWFPAMGVNVGAPAGNRNEHWLTGPNISGQPNAATTCQHSSYVCPDILRRDYANAIMLARPNIGVARVMFRRRYSVSRTGQLHHALPPHFTTRCERMAAPVQASRLFRCRPAKARKNPAS
jgi:hypothetical protein